MTDTTIGHLVRAATKGTLMGIVLVAIVLLFARALSDDLLVDLPGSDAPQDVTVGATLFNTVLGGIVGTVLAYGANRFAPRPKMTFVAVCVVSLVLYGILPFSAAEETATAVWLNIMHVAVAIPIVGALASSLPEKRA